MAWMTALAIGTMVASTVVQARAQKKASARQAEADDANAAFAREQAVDAARRGVEEESVFRRDVRRALGSQRAGYAGQNVDVNVGTAPAMRASSEQLLQSDLGRIRRNAEREAHGYTVQGEEYSKSAKYARSAGKWAVAGTVLGGATESLLLAHRFGWYDKPPATARPGR